MDRNHLEDAQFRLNDAAKILRDEAQKALREGRHHGAFIATADQMLQWSQAAATIALAEAAREANKPRFVQIGKRAYNIEHIQNLRFGDTPPFPFDDKPGPCVVIWYGFFIPEEGNSDVLYGEDAEAFTRWWNANNNADVARLDTEPSNGPDWDTAKEAQ